MKQWTDETEREAEQAMPPTAAELIRFGLAATVFVLACAGVALTATAGAGLTAFGLVVLAGAAAVLMVK